VSGLDATHTTVMGIGLGMQGMQGLEGGGERGYRIVPNLLHRSCPGRKTLSHNFLVQAHNTSNHQNKSPPYFPVTANSEPLHYTLASQSPQNVAGDVGVT